MRFRKSVKICKGVRLNISKSGVSMTAGIKGASVNIGKNGTYLNTGIPGTGIYDRKKIGGSKPKASTNTNARVTGEFTLQYNDDASVDIMDKNGIKILDPGVIRQIKKTYQYKAEIERMSKKRLLQVEEITSDFTAIHKSAAEVQPQEFYKQYLENLEPSKYTKKEFNTPPPSMDDIVTELKALAEKQVSILKFWKKKSIVNKYVEENKNSLYDQQMLSWESDKKNFDEKEASIKKEQDKEFENDFLQEKNLLELLLSNDNESIDGMIQSWLSTLEFPFDFDLQYDIIDNTFCADLDLPEIEDMPLHKAQQMANGTVKIKNKTQKEIKADYCQCVLGLAVFFASHLFNIAIGIDTIILSAYTQRKDNKAQINDEYIYSIKFNRNDLANIDMVSDARLICFAFEHVCDIKADLTFKKIKPFS